MQDSICLNEYNASWNTILGYTDPCKIKQAKSLSNFGSIQNSNEDYVNCSDPDAYVNDTFQIMHVETRGVRGFEKECSDQERLYVYVIPPPGVIAQPGAFEIFKNNSTTSLTQLSFEQKGDTVWTYWDASDKFVGGKYDIRIKFIPNCSAEPGRIDIRWFGQCPPCGCNHLWYCERFTGRSSTATTRPAQVRLFAKSGRRPPFGCEPDDFRLARPRLYHPVQPGGGQQKVAIPATSLVRMQVLSIVRRRCR